MKLLFLQKVSRKDNKAYYFLRSFFICPYSRKNYYKPFFADEESGFPHRKVTLKRQRDVRAQYEMLDEIGR